MVTDFNNDHVTVITDNIIGPRPYVTFRTLVFMVRSCPPRPIPKLIDLK